MRTHRDGSDDIGDGSESAVDIQDTPSDDADRRAELVDGPAAGGFRAIRLEHATTPPATIDIELDDGTHAAYIYVGRRGDADITAYAYCWDRQEPATAPIT